MTPAEVIEEMRTAQELREWSPLLDMVGDWQEALEAAMREPVAWWVEDENGEPYGKGRYAVRFMPDDRPGRTVTPLYALPPDQSAEIERLNNKLNQDSQQFQILCQETEIEQLREENARLRALVEFEPDLEAALAAKEVTE